MQPTMTFSSLARTNENKKRFNLRSIFSKDTLRRFTSIKFLAVLIIIFQLAILYILINPINILNQLNSVQIINKVSKLTVVPAGEVPTAIGTVGDNVLLPDADTLRKDNEIQAQVYKDVKNGDYVILYSNKMVIFRDSENRVIYEGSTPAQILNQNQQTLITNLIAKVKELGIITKDNSESPIARILSADLLKTSQEKNPDFYSEAKENDIVAEFVSENKIILYRADGNTVVKYGDIAIR